jgi:hypothetical protein
VVNFNRSFIGYGYAGDDRDGTITGMDGVSVVGVTKGGVVVFIAASFKSFGHECGRAGCLSGSNKSKTSPFNKSGDDGLIPI